MGFRAICSCCRLLICRNPAVLPTGKNIHALDPQSIPTTAAVKSAEVRIGRIRPTSETCQLPLLVDLSFSRFAVLLTSATLE